MTICFRVRGKISQKKKNSKDKQKHFWKMERKGSEVVRARDKWEEAGVRGYWNSILLFH